ncbi:MAG TPA: phosphoglycerate kinase [Candidatus Saccharimonadales bacterium]|nr:phosphoglycerate kinase [Candidatus Saccharimonadales bacterium]
MTFFKKTIKDVPLAGRTVLVRADYNVPLTPQGKIHDDYRMQQSLPTLQYLLEQGCKVVICAHLGRPEGKVNPEFSLEAVATHLGKLLDRPVTFVPQSVGDLVKQTVRKLPAGSVALLENLRFHPGEEANDPAFAKRLATDSTATYFVQDGFGVVHRKHASTDAITQFLPSVAGLLLRKEYMAITNAVEHPQRPLTIVMGGAKVADKIDLIEKFIEIADTLIIGGAIANTFLKFYAGYEVGKSIYDADAADEVARLMQKACQKWCQQPKDSACDCLTCPDCAAHLLLPVDVAVGTAIDPATKREVAALTEVDADDYILDMGKETISRMVDHLEKSGQVLWNGTLGYAEIAQFAYGSNFVAGTLASNHGKIANLIGGGDTADFVMHWLHTQHRKVEDCFDHVSTGGGASLDLLAGKKLPGIEALLDA